MNIIFWGTPEYSVETLKSLIESTHQIKAVVTQPDKKRSRGNKLIPSPVKKLAISNNIPVYNPSKIKDNDKFLEIIKSLNSDLFIVIAYGKILSKEILSIPKYGSWNAHASLLPRWRGAAPIQWSLLEGDDYTGVGIMKMEEGLDTGDILLEKEIKIKENDNLVSLSQKLSLTSSNLISELLLLIKKNPDKIETKLVPQNSKCKEIKYARMINKEDYKLKLDDSAINIERKVKGLYPRAFIKYKNRNLKILNIRLLKEDEINEIYINGFEEITHEAGQVLKIYKNEGIVISTKTVPIVINEIKLEGKNVAYKNQLIQQLDTKIGEII